MMKRLLSLLLVLAMMMPCALADTHNVSLQKLKSKTASERLATEKEREKLIEQVVEQIRKSDIYHATYSAFDIENAQETAIAGLDEEGQLFIAILNISTNVLLLVEVDPETYKGTFKVKGDSRDTYLTYYALAEAQGTVDRVGAQEAAGRVLNIADKAKNNPWVIPEMVRPNVFQSALMDIVVSVYGDKRTVEWANTDGGIAKIILVDEVGRRYTVGEYAAADAAMQHVSVIMMVPGELYQDAELKLTKEMMDEKCHQTAMVLAALLLQGNSKRTIPEALEVANAAVNTKIRPYLEMYGDAEGSCYGRNYQAVVQYGEEADIFRWEMTFPEQLPAMAVMSENGIPNRLSFNDFQQVYNGFVQLNFGLKTVGEADAQHPNRCNISLVTEDGSRMDAGYVEVDENGNVIRFAQETIYLEFSMDSLDAAMTMTQLALSTMLIIGGDSANVAYARAVDKTNEFSYYINGNATMPHDPNCFGQEISEWSFEQMQMLGGRVYYHFRLDIGGKE